ncbi:hypothetical protein IV203_034867 [Nitzschia inconspicua]|uniref:Integrator complex subunit 7 helical bundle domain-containing protein n=1 Tax=Nitzschia inconspicua TaxID=303405 RepID=A0A9K3LDL8_9STRA|nr:hypothetical protein IV203_034867 [Nitzschia inconspicua]
MKGEVTALIQEMELACRRPLFKGIQCAAAMIGGEEGKSHLSGGGGPSTPSESASFSYPESDTGSNLSMPKTASNSKREFPGSDQEISWQEILSDAAALLRFMTDDEHGQVSRLTGLLLLGFLVPQSTGCEFFLLENLSSKRLKKAGISQSFTANKQLSEIQEAEYVQEKEDMGEYIIQMSLEERLEACPHWYNPDEFGEFNSMVFDPLEDAFQSFLQRGLAPFLAGRPAHTSQVDLLHILAMAIHPQPSEQPIQQTASKLEEEESKSWDKAKRLMTNWTATSFRVNYRHRLEIVRLVTDCLVVPTQNKTRAFFDAPLFDGALPHLRAALCAFGMASIHPMDEHIAACGMVSLAVQSGIDYVIKEEWNRLTHKMVDDRTNYPSCPHCRCGNKYCSRKPRAAPCYNAAFSLVDDDNRDSFCPHRARGRLLQSFVTRYNEARYFADEEFLKFALGSLTDAIEMQLDLWTHEKDDRADKNKASGDADSAMGIDIVPATAQPTCVLASLLSSAKCLFYFFLPIKLGKKEIDSQDEEEESEVSYRRDILVSSGIQLLHHWDFTIVKEACSMLLLAFSYADQMWGDYVSAVFASLKMSVELDSKNLSDDSRPLPIAGLVSAFSHRSMSFATSFMQFLLKMKDEQKIGALELYRLVAAVATACPIVAEQNRVDLENCLKTAKSKGVSEQIIASLLPCRKARFFAKEDVAESKLSSLIFDSKLDNWQQYQIARHSMIYGSFSLAKTLYDDLALSAASEKSYVWLLALQQVCEGEAAIAMDAAKALREGSSCLTMAICTLRSLPSMVEHEGGSDFSCDFQIGFLDLRISLLDLLTAARQLTREMRLIGNGPKKYTRPHLHLRNIVRELFGLRQRYLTFYKQNGLFICQQSRSVIRTISSLCNFIGKALERVFHESLPEKAEKDSLSDSKSTSGGSHEPLAQLMKQLESLALNDMDPSVEGKIRAAVLLEIMDGILKAPFPFPKSFTMTKTIPRSEVHVTWDPKMHEHVESLNIRTDGRISLLVSGIIEKSLLTRVNVPFNIILLCREPGIA